MYQPLNGPAKQGTLSIGTSTPVEVKNGSDPFDERQVITLQGDGKFYIYFADEGEVPNAATVTSNGFTQYKNAKETYEASCNQAVFVLALSGTVDIKLAERG